MNKIVLFGAKFICLIGSIMLLENCSTPNTPENTKYLKDFNEVNFVQTNPQLDNGLSLYVDYSKCISEGVKSQFFKNVTAAFGNDVTDYFSIKGKEIKKESLVDSSTYTRLQHIEETNYADLKTAAEKIALGNQEAILLTDGEYYNTIDKSNDNNPYFAEAFKIWMKKGHDIYIISEPYEENAQKGDLSKKRFYFIFTDIRKVDNAYEKIKKNVSIQENQEFHLSADHPGVFAKNNSSIPNPTLAAQTEACGLYEIQDWSVDWNTIEEIILNGVNNETGEPLPNGDCVISGLKLDRNTFGGYKITDVDVQVTNINDAYMDFYTNKTNGMKIGNSTIPMMQCPHFFILDKKEFKSHSNLNLYFDVQNYDDSFLDGSPFNYLKVDFYVSNVEYVIENYKEMFTFPSISAGESINESVYKSVQSALTDHDLEHQMKKSPFYTIYIKCNEK